MHMKKCLAFLLICTLMVSAFLYAVAETHTSGDWQYIILEDGTAEIVKYYGNQKKLIIPESLDGHIVSCIGDDAFFGSEYFNEVTIPDSITDIGANPFRYFTSVSRINVSPDHPYLAVIDGVLFSKPDKRMICYPGAFTASEYTIPQGIKIIGESAFGRNSNLTKVNIPDSVTAIDDHAFEMCDSLPAITIPESVTDIGAGAFSACEALIYIILPDSVTSIGDGVFSGCTSLKKVTIQGGITAISERAFESCMLLTDVYLPDSVTVIGNSAFLKCEAMSKITIPAGVVTIGDGAFESCIYMAQVNLPDSVTNIGSNPFLNCYSLKQIIVSPDHQYLETIDGVLFSKPDKRLVSYPKGFTASDYTVPQGTKVIGKNAFSHCSGLAEIILPDSLTEIGDYAFDYCSDLSEINLPDSLTKIGDYAFLNCKSLTKLTIPDSVTAIGHEAFKKCSEDLTITVGRGSRAEQYCKVNGIIYMFPDSNDWLNN